MFKLIAILFIAANPEPVGVMEYKSKDFLSEKACMEFVKSADGKKLLKAASDAAKTRSATVKFACAQSKAKKNEDNSI
jgi:hypothetical protein